MPRVVDNVQTYSISSKNRCTSVRVIDSIVISSYQRHSVFRNLHSPQQQDQDMQHVHALMLADVAIPDDEDTPAKNG